MTDTPATTLKYLYIGKVPVTGGKMGNAFVDVTDLPNDGTPLPPGALDDGLKLYGTQGWPRKMRPGMLFVLESPEPGRVVVPKGLYPSGNWRCGSDLTALTLLHDARETEALAWKDVQKIRPLWNALEPARAAYARAVTPAARRAVLAVVIEIVTQGK